MDRERSIRSLAETVLDYAGYIVLAAETPEQAIETAQANANRISLVLLDPDIVERKELLGHVRPGTRFVLATDYDASMAAFAANMVNASNSHDQDKNIDLYGRAVNELLATAKETGSPVRRRAA